MPEETEIQRRQDDLDDRFGAGPAPDLYFAPGRVNIIGEHTDYNGGLVLPIAIRQGTYMLVRGSDNPAVRLYSANLDSEVSFDPSEIERTGDWADYVRGVYLFSNESFCGLPPFDAEYFGDLPLGAGLSSSASIELVTCTGFRTLGCTLSSENAVKVSRRAENEFVDVSCGIMDQFAVAFAKEGFALMIDCDLLEYHLVPYNLQGSSIVVVHTGVSRSLSDSPYNTRRKECERALEIIRSKIGEKKNLSELTVKDFEKARWSLSDRLARRVEHVVFENVRVEQARWCLENGDTEELGNLMNRSHESLRDLYEVSSKELDTLQRISLQQEGVYGCRMTGAGFGGCAIALVQDRAIDDYLRRVPELYWQATRYEPTVIVTSPGGGARKVER